MAAPPEPLTVLRGHRAEVNCVRFGWANQSRQLLVSGDAAGDVLVWDLSTRRPCKTLSEAHPSGVIEATIITGSAEGTPTSWLYTQGRDNSVCVWNLTDLLTPASSTSSASGPRPTPAVSLPDSDHSFCKMAIGVPTTQDTSPSKSAEGVQSELEPEPEPTSATEPRADVPPRLVGLASTTDSNMSIWDTRRSRVEVTIEAQAAAEAEAAGTAVQSGQCMCMHFCTVFPSESAGVDEAVVGRSVLTLMAGYEDGKVAVYCQAPAGRWQPAGCITLHEEPVLSIADATYTSKRGRSATRLVSCGADGRIALWEVHIIAPAQGVNAARVRIDPLTHEQATPSGGGAQGLRTADKAGMNQVAVRQDGRLAATAGWDGTVRIFDLRKQLRLLAALTYHRDGVHTVAFATAPPASAAQARTASRAKPFGGTTAADPWLLASGGADGRIALWRLYPPT